ncbi:hypothetical protein EU537_05560 [Candidatus Thorarchaeota archaeon]|nr:MAG: hypothetical protein EU537_05560 [Candidatus Thorarchaeota archaeon]
MATEPIRNDESMLKEVFLIDEGLLQFHYSNDSSASEDDKAVLSSGLLTALQDFSSQARSGSLESFLTGDEYFLFTKCPETDRVVVGVFHRLAPEELARESLERIQEVFKSADIPDASGKQLPGDEKQRLRNLIKEIGIHLFDKEYFELHIEELLKNRSDIPLAFLVDTTDNSLVTHFARPKPLFRKSQLDDFRLLYSTLEKSLTSLGIATEYSYFIIKSQGYSAASYNSVRFASVASGAMRIDSDAVLDVAIKMCVPSGEIPDMADLDQGEIEGVSLLFNNGILKHERGERLPSMSQVYLSTLVNNADAFFKSVNRRVFTRFDVFGGIAQPKSISLIREGDGKSLRVEIRRFQ